MNRSVLFAGLLVVGSASLGCVAPVSQGSDGVESVGAADLAIAGDGASTYFIVTHPDTRKCAYPTCGGSFVKRVNRPSTQCADGVYRSECHVVDVDLSAIGLADADSAKFQDTFAGGYGLVRGSLGQGTDARGRVVDTLSATEAWVTATLSKPTGTFHGLSSSGIVCITTPCPTILEEKLDYTSTHLIDEVDFTGSGANEKQITQAMSLMAGDGILAAGLLETMAGTGGRGTRLVASQFYTQLAPAPASGVQCGTNTCSEGQYCCNESCGMCARIGAMCIQKTCP